jgi:hypothetical protein
MTLKRGKTQLNATCDAKGPKEKPLNLVASNISYLAQIFHNFQFQL